MTATYPCPNCEKPAELSNANPWRPFCSERCRLIDLGEWMSEKNRIPAEHEDFGQEQPGEDTQH